MKPWVTKKIVEYLGEEEPTLIDFVVNKMGDHMAPQEILGQLTFVLEDEAEVFVIKLWRCVPPFSKTPFLVSETAGRIRGARLHQSLSGLIHCSLQKVTTKEKKHSNKNKYKHPPQPMAIMLTPTLLNGFHPFAGCSSLR